MTARTISLSLFRNATADCGDWRSLALAIAADSRTLGWPPVVIRDLYRIGTTGAHEPVDLAKLETCLNRLDAAHV